MNLDTYQELALRTKAPYSSEPLELATHSLGLVGESGEVADHIKKYLGHGHELDKTKVAKELGDVLWYVAILAHNLGYNLDTIAQNNIDKLAKRYGDKFSSFASINRKDE